MFRSASRCLPFVASVLIAASFLTSCQKPQGFEYRGIRNIGVNQMGFEKTRVQMELVYFNPNHFGVQLKHVDCDIYLDKNYVGKYVLDTLMHIPREAEFFLPARIELDMRTVFRNALQVFLAGDVLVEVKGTTRVGKAGVFINVPFNYSGRQKFSLF